ncbi:MAG TPA: NAD(P)-dependent alcohol dehydrogenase [Acidimicrobiia bacterium]|nr:NAD(P)-dependent alcohol dehydrogenase [Acidimicrobiia bacterium]
MSAVEPAARIGEVLDRRTMRAMVQERYGAASEVLQFRDVPIPEIGSSEVLVRVHSSSVNAMEWHLMNGKPYVFRAVFGFRPKQPTLGADVAGTVVATGDNVTRFRVGDEVLGEIVAGAYAEFARARDDHLVNKPANVSFEEAAAVGVAGLTALQGLRDELAVGPGQKVLIIGGSGGVGTYAIQVAKFLGAEVTAVCSTRNVDQARELGADHVVDYQKEDITLTAERFDAIFDIPGNLTLRSCKRLMAHGGVYAMVGGAKGSWTGPLFRMIRAMFLFAFGDKRNTTFTATSRADDLATLAELLSSGQIRSVIEDTYPLAEIAGLIDRQGRFHARAKTVIKVEGTV